MLGRQVISALKHYVLEEDVVQSLRKDGLFEVEGHVNFPVIKDQAFANLNVALTKAVYI